MSTFLQLCQDVARESGTFPNVGDPATVASQSGRMLRLISWVKTAYEDIQRHRNDWRWLHADFSGQTISGTRTYDSAAMSISDRFSRWIFQGEEGENLFSIYKTSEGQDTEQHLNFMNWHEFRRERMVGSAASDTGKPTHVSVNYSDELVFYPTPDAAYTVRGVYFKSPQILSVDADTPEMPSQFHDAIRYKALILMGGFDEAGDQMPFWSAELFKLMEELIKHQTPRIRTAGPLA